MKGSEIKALQIYKGKTLLPRIVEELYYKNGAMRVSYRECVVLGNGKYEKRGGRRHILLRSFASWATYKFTEEDWICSNGSQGSTS